jgi:hypothetical protein
MMYAGNARSYEKADSFNGFTVLFTGKNLMVGGKTYPVGQITTDVLNMDQQDIINLTVESAKFADYAKRKLMDPKKKKNPAVFSAVEEKLGGVLDRIAAMPLYRDLRTDWNMTRRFLTIMYEHQPEVVKPLLTPGTPESLMAEDWFEQFTRIGFELSTFWTYIRAMVDVFFEPLLKRGAEAYAVGLYRFWSNTEILNRISQELPQSPAFLFRQSAQVELEFVPMPDPEDKTRYVIAERVVFHSIGEFLQAEFYRALQHGNAPRRCHNCENFFLLTAGYNTCYCNDIAPGETERTCRKVGAHKKAATKERTPAQVEYQRVYNRLKTQKSRGKISVDEWNALVAQAQEVKDQAERGELSDEEMKVTFEGMGRG